MTGREVVALRSTGRAVVSRAWGDGVALRGRGGDVDWVCGDCGAIVIDGLRRPETLRTAELRCTACRRYQHLG